MARTLRGRTVGGDNISVGNASGTEKIAIGILPPAEVIGGGSNIVIAAAYPTAIIADNQQIGVTTMLKERLG